MVGQTLWHTVLLLTPLITSFEKGKADTYTFLVGIPTWNFLFRNHDSPFLTFILFSKPAGNSRILPHKRIRNYTHSPGKPCSIRYSSRKVTQPFKLLTSRSSPPLNPPLQGRKAYRFFKRKWNIERSLVINNLTKVKAPVCDPISVCVPFAIFSSIDEVNDQNRTIIVINIILNK